MQPRFQEDKATQVAAELLRLRGGKMSYMKLLKLMYLVDRTALIRWGRPVTYDSFVSMRHGPVLSRTLDLINEQPPPDKLSTWNQIISAPHEYDVKLLDDCPTSELSEAEIKVTREIDAQYGGLDKWELVKVLHDELPEWENPGDSALPIDYRDVLVAGGKKNPDIEEIESELHGIALLEAFVS